MSVGTKGIPAVERFMWFSFIYTSLLVLHKTHIIFYVQAHEKSSYVPLLPTHTRAHTHTNMLSDAYIQIYHYHLLGISFTVGNNETALSGVHFWGSTSLWERSFKCTPCRLPGDELPSFMAEQAVPDEWEALEGFCASEATLTNSVWHVPKTLVQVGRGVAADGESRVKVRITFHNYGSGRKNGMSAKRTAGLAVLLSKCQTTRHLLDKMVSNGE